MKFHENKLLTTAAAVALALAVGACSSSSSDDDEMAGTPPPVTDGDGDAMNGDGDAMNGDGDAMNGDGDGDAKTPAQALAAAQDVYKALTDASTDEDRATAVAALEEALKLEGNEAAYVAYLKKQIDDQAQTVADAAAKAGLAERLAREVVVKAAIERADNRVGDGNTAKLFPTGIEAGDLVVERDAAGKLTVDVNGDTDDVYAGGETTAGDGDWNSVTMTKTDAVGVADTLVIYTDIVAPADVQLTKHYDLGDRMDILNDLDLLKKARSDSFPAGATETKVFGVTSGNPASFGGMFDGVPGTFECTDTTDGCTLVTDAEGGLTASAMWTFSPNSNLATVKVPDASYTYFGWWLNKPKENIDVHDVEVFAGGTATAAPATLAMVGNASYSGPAAGKYVTKTFTAGPQTDAGVGHFTATANLTAKFGLADGDVGTIGGSVTGFELDDGTSPVWTVKLEDAELTDNIATFNGDTEVNFGGGLTAVAGSPAGTWEGSFYDADTPNPTKGPSTVVGRFDAVTDNASVIGAFGAKRQ